ncbi:ABC transporter ATP-binding protein [Veillonella sp. CHU110]|uniref:ABC transporter ATP-binding protein n=1 Tax=Veillonella sp. CHU110 TaxID=2490947 RepID=UPI000F8C4664|nr:ABC transporter ATP-binding protein [Veillonella sp. CHU110]
MKGIHLFRHFFKEHSYKYIVGIILLLIINGLFLLVPTWMGEAINTLYVGKDGIWNYVGLFIALGLVVTFLKYISRHMLLGSIRNFEFYLRRELFHHALRIPTSYYDEHGPGKVMALMTNDVTSLRVSLGLGVMLFVDAIFFGVIAFCILVQKMSLWLAVVTILPMPFIVVGMLQLSKRLRRCQKEAQSSYSDVTEYAQELFLGMAVIQAFNKEYRSWKRFTAVNKINYNNNLEVVKIDSLLTPLTYMAPFVCYALNMYVCGQAIIQGNLTVGEFVALNGYVMLVIGPIMAIGSLTAVLQKGMASLERMVDFFDLPQEEVQTDVQTLGLEDITIKHLDFTYPSSKEPILKDVTMHIPKGSFIGIVGGPGSGKSTLFKLLLDIQHAPKGCIYFGDMDIHEIPVSTLRRSIAYAPATPSLLSVSIRDNIQFGYSDENRHTLSIEEAAERAGLFRDLEERIEGARKDDSLGEGGSDVSGGQRQRISLARAFYKEAPYTLLDDAFSALDAHSLSHILETLRTHRNQTILCISQRLEALRDADCIYVFHEGRIIESGTHDELLAKEGMYHQLAMLQRRGEGHEE